MGPLGGIHNLDVITDASNDLFPKLKTVTSWISA